MIEFKVPDEYVSTRIEHYIVLFPRFLTTQQKLNPSEAQQTTNSIFYYIPEPILNEIRGKI